MLLPELRAPWAAAATRFARALIALVPRVDFNLQYLAWLPQTTATAVGMTLVAAGERVPYALFQLLAVILIDCSDTKTLRTFDVAGRSLSIFQGDGSPLREELEADAIGQQGLALASTIIMDRYVGFGLDQIRAKDLRFAAIVWASLGDHVGQSQAAARVPDVLLAAVRRMVAERFEVPAAQTSILVVFKLYALQDRLRDAIATGGLIETMAVTWSTDWDAFRASFLARTVH